MVNPNADEIVLPCFACVGNLIPVSAVSVALAEPVRPGEVSGALPDHLEDIVMGSHPFLGEAGQLLFRKCWRVDRLSPALVHVRPQWS